MWECIKQRQRQRQRRHLGEKNMNLHFPVEFRRCLDLFSTSVHLRTNSSLICNAIVQFQMKIRKIARRCSRFAKYRDVVLHRMVTKCRCTKIYNVHCHCFTH